MASYKVVSFDGLDQMENVVSVFELDSQFLYNALLERQRFSGSAGQRRARDRYVTDMLAKYGALGEVHLRTMTVEDDWDDTDPRERDRRGL